MQTEQQDKYQSNLHGVNAYRPVEEEIFLRPISRRLARILSKTQLHPNTVSFLGFFIVLGISAWLILSSSYNYILLAILLYIAIVLDKLDGDLAREKGIAGVKGQYIDGYLDLFSEIILIGGWAFAFGKDIYPLLLYISCASTAIFNYHSISAPFYLALVPNTHKSPNELSHWNKLAIALGYGRAKLFFIMILSLLVGIPNIIFYLLPLLLLYTSIAFARNIFIKKLTAR